LGISQAADSVIVFVVTNIKILALASPMWKQTWSSWILNTRDRMFRMVLVHIATILQPLLVF